MKHRTYLQKQDSAVQAGVDFVLFDDGTYWGDDKSQVLRDVHGEIGALRAAKRTLDGDLADSTRDKYLSARKIEGANR